MDLSGFVYNYNEVSAAKTELTEFFFEDGEIREFKLIKDNILLTLKEGPDGKISECRVMMTKLNENGEESKNVSIDSKNFLYILKNTLRAFCGYDENSAEAIIDEFSLNEPGNLMKEGELTKKQGNFYFVYYSTQLVCQMMVYNTYLTEIEPTEKPAKSITNPETTAYELK